MRTTCADKCLSQDTVITSQNYKETNNVKQEQRLEIKCYFTVSTLFNVFSHFFSLRLVLPYHHVFDDGGRPRSVVMGTVTIRTVKATLYIISIVKDHSQHDLISQGILER